MTKTLADSSLTAHEPLRRELEQWLAKARRSGLDDESIEALFLSTYRAASDRPASLATSSPATKETDS